jgi:hypothetical protein
VNKDSDETIGWVSMDYTTSKTDPNYLARVVATKATSL